jgi:hypothetical protein
MTKIDKLTKVNDCINVHRYDNGWMVEISGRDKKDDYKTIKIICNTEEDLFSVLKEWNSKDLDN